MEFVWGGVKGAGVLDYVTCWYVKAARYITGVSAIAGTAANTNAVATLDTAFTNDPPTLADIEVLRAKLNELILNGRR